MNNKNIFKLIFLFLLPFLVLAQGEEIFEEEKENPDKKEFNFIGYYFIRGELNNIAPTNEFLKGQVVGRIFGGNTTKTSNWNEYCHINSIKN